jgi:hypothetical protein
MNDASPGTGVRVGLGPLNLWTAGSLTLGQVPGARRPEGWGRLSEREDRREPKRRGEGLAGGPRWGWLDPAGHLMQSARRLGTLERHCS